MLRPSSTLCREANVRGGGGVAVVSHWVDLDGPMHFADFGGPSDGPLLICVHGLGGSHLNWRYEAAMRAIRQPVLLVHGEKDRLVAVEAARRAVNPRWTFEV